MLRVRRLPVTLLGLGLALTGLACSVEEALPAPDCIQGDSGLIVAQSVPSADLVPCFLTVPAGWNVSSVRIDQDGTVVKFDSDRAGGDAGVLHFVEVCEPGSAVEITSDQEGADRLELIDELGHGFRARRYYLFPGGCVWWDFDFDDGAPAGLSVELGNSLLLITREAINENISQSFIDEEL